MSQRVLVLTLSSGLGANLANNLSQHYYTYGSFWKKRIHLPNIISSRVDLTRKDSIERVMTQFRPDIVIYTPPIFGFYHAIENPELIDLFLVKGTLNCAYACERSNIHLVFISNSCIFSGENAPYHEDALSNPLSYLGGLYSHAETIVQKTLSRHTILRVAQFLAPSLSLQNTFYDYLILKLLSEETVKIDHKYKSGVSDLALVFEVLQKVINDSTPPRILNVTSSNSLSQYQVGSLVAKKFGYNVDLLLASDIEFPRDRRKYRDPSYKDKRDFTLSSEKLSEYLGKPILSLEEIIERMF